MHPKLVNNERLARQLKRRANEWVEPAVNLKQVFRATKVTVRTAGECPAITKIDSRTDRQK
jgi:hypothetical protein